MCRNDTYSRVQSRQEFVQHASNRNDLKQGDALSPLLFNFCFKSTPLGGFR